MLGSRSFYCIFDHTDEIFALRAKRQRDDLCKNRGCRVISSKEAHAPGNWQKIQKIGYHAYPKFAANFNNTRRYIQLTIWDVLTE